MSPLLLALALYFVLAAGFHAVSLGLVVRRLRTPLSSLPAGRERPPVTILVPVRGIENNIRRTLASRFTLAYPRYDLIFCVASAGDPIIPVVQSLIDAHPQVPARILVGDERVGINPKLNNLVKGWAAAEAAWVAMIDSNVLLPPDAIDQLLAAWDDKTGVATSPALCSAPAGLWADMECAFMNTYQARAMLFADIAGIGFAHGKTMLWRKADLDAAGGIRVLAAEVAEDAAATKLVRGRGRRVRSVQHPFPQPIGQRSFTEVWQRQVRWARIRRSAFPLGFAFEVLAGGLLPALALATIAAAWDWPLAVVPAFLTAWYAAEYAAARLCGWPALATILLGMVLRDLLLPVIWLAGWLGNRFEWRGNDMTIGSAADLRQAGAPKPPRRRTRLFSR